MRLRIFYNGAVQLEKIPFAVHGVFVILTALNHFEFLKLCQALA